MKIYISPKRKELTHTLLNIAIANGINNYPKKIYLIVPETISYTYEKEAILKNKGTLLNFEILTFSRILNKIFSKLNIDNMDYLSDIDRKIILKNIISNVDLEYLNKSYNTIDSISDIIEKIYQNKKSALKITEYIKNNENILKYKLKDLIKIFNIYGSKIRENNKKDKAQKMQDLINKLHDFNFFADSLVIFDGFSFFSKEQFELIEQIIIQTQDVYFGIYLDKIENTNNLNNESYDLNNEAFKVSRKTFEKLLSILQKNGIKKEIVLVEKENQIHLENDIDRFKKISKINAFDNVSDEFRYIANDIYERVKRDNIKFSDISCILGEIGTSDLFELKKILDNSNIEYSYTKIKKMIDSRLAKIVLSILNFSISKNYRSIFEFLEIAEKYFLIDFTKEQIESFKIYIKRWEKYNFWEKNWDFEKETNENYIKIIEIRDFLNDFSKNIKDSKSFLEIATKLFEILNNGIFQKEYTEIKNLNKEYLNEYEISVSKLNNALDLVVGIGKYFDKQSAEDFFEIFKNYLTKITLSDISKDEGIKILSTNEVTFDSKITYILNANDGIFPNEITKNSIISEKENLELLLDDIDLDMTLENYGALSLNEVYNIFERSEELIFNYVLKNENSTIYPSYILKKYKNEFKEEYDKKFEKIKKEKIYSIDHVFTKENAIEYILYNLREDILDDNIENLEKIRSGEFEKIFKKNINKDILNKETVDKLYHSKFTTSISRLEKYAICPFAYSCQYVLNIKEKEKYDLTVQLSGTFIHETFKNFVDLIKSKKLGYVNLEQNENEIEKLYNEAFLKTINMPKYEIFKNNEKFSILLEKLKREQIKNAKNIVKSLLGEFIIYQNEMPVFKEMKIDDEHNIRLSGIVDRVDISKDEEKLRVIDYKSGEKNINIDYLREGLQIQLFTYANILEEKLKRENVGVIYHNLKEKNIEINSRMDEDILKEIEQITKKEKPLKGAIKGVKNFENMNFKDLISDSIYDVEKKKSATIYEKKEFEYLSNLANDAIIKTCKQILSGNVLAYPFKDKQIIGCDYCNYNSICGFNKKNSKFRIIYKRGIIENK